MKRFPFTLIIFIFAAVGLWFCSRGPDGDWQKNTTDNTPPDQTTALAKAAKPQNTRTEAIIASNFSRVQTPPASVAEIKAAGTPSALEVTNIAPAQVLESMSRAIRNYGDTFGGNPVGTNPEIARQLDGENPKHIHFLNPESGMRLNANGELVDAWGTPYFFHQLSAHQMEIHSAGPDKQMWTADDMVSK